MKASSLLMTCFGQSLLPVQRLAYSHSFPGVGGVSALFIFKFLFSLY